MSLSFRPATEKDVPLISQLADKIWHEHYPAIISVEQINFMLRLRYSPAALAEQMKNGERFFLAFYAEEPVGYASFDLQDPSAIGGRGAKNSGRYYYLHKFYVDVSKHRAGIGTEFFTYLLQHTKTGSPMRLQVNRLNYKAVNFYFKMGFVIERTGDFHIGGNYYMNDFVMVRK